MLVIKVLLIFLISVECRNFTRKYGPKKESYQKTGKRSRSEVFEDLFNVYDPSYLAIIWPKVTNGLHLLLDHQCWDDVTVFLKDLSDGKSWAYNVLDSTGRYGSSLFGGNRFWLGSKEQCLRLDKESLNRNNNNSLEIFASRKEHNFENDVHDWRVVQTRELLQQIMREDQVPPHRLSYSVLQVNLNITKFNMIKTYDVLLGVCLPLSCSSQDVTSIISFSLIINDNLKTNRTTPRVAKITKPRLVSDNYDINTDVAAIVLICITVILLSLAITATILDLKVTQCLPYNKTSMKFDLEKYQADTNNYKNKSTDRYKGNGDNPITDDVKNELEQLELEKAKMNFMAVEKMLKCVAPTITPDVNCADRTANSCKRCGKYRKQCRTTKPSEHLPPCPRIKYNSTNSLSTDGGRRNVFYRLLLCFSMKHCWRRVFNTNTASKHLSLVHTMRIIATLWLIYVHVAVITDYLSGHLTEINEHTNVYFTLATGTIAFDTLFFISGLISSHHFFFLNSQYSTEELVGFQGAFGQFMQFVCFVVNRIIRLLPSYGYAVLLSVVLSRVLYETSAVALPEGDHSTCGSYWWRNMLYISTFYPREEQCMQISWYLSSETQLHAAAVLLCAASAASSLRARAAVTLAFGAVLASTVSDASAAYFEHTRYLDAFAAYRYIVERPWARVSPYFIGVFLGWMIHTMRGKLKVSKVTTALLWATAGSFTFASWTVPWVGLPWVAAWLHLTWPIALIWPVLLCSTNLAGSFRRWLCTAPLAGLSRLCYGMLLVHGPVARAVLLALGGTLCSRTVCIWVYFSGTALLSLGAALLLALLVEIPCCSLLRRLSHCAT